MAPVLESDVLHQVCDRCRIKKTRCTNRNSGTCDQCAAVNLTCRSTQKLSRRSHPRSYTQSLEARVRELESQLSNAIEYRLPGDNHAFSEGSPLEPFNETPFSPPRQFADAEQVKRLDSVGLKSEEEAAENIDGSQITTYELGRLVQGPDQKQYFIGACSGVYFLDRTLDICSPQSDGIPHSTAMLQFPEPLLSTNSICTSWITLSGATPLAMRSDPDREKAKRYAAYFFDCLSRTLPALHRPTFEAAMNRLYDNWYSESMKDFVPIFYLVMALGSLFHQYQQDNFILTVESEPCRYYAAAKECQNLYLTGGSFQQLQFQLLEFMFVGVLGDNSRIIQLIARMCRLAQQLGLHRHVRRFNELTALEREMRSRVFWCVYSADAFTAALFGLPKCLFNADIDADFPTEIDDEFVTVNGYSTVLPGQALKMTAFISLCELAKILSMTQEQLYTTTDRRSAPSKVNRLRKHLERWKIKFDLEESPMGRRYGDMPANDHASWTMQALVYEYIQWILTRQSLSLHTSDPAYWAAWPACYDSSCNILDLCHSNMEVLGRLPFNCVNTRASIILASLVVLLRHCIGNDANLGIYESRYSPAQARDVCQKALDLLQLRGAQGMRISVLPEPDLAELMRKAGLSGS